MNPLEEAKEILGDSFEKNVPFSDPAYGMVFKLQEAMLKLIEHIQTLQPIPNHRPQHASQDADDGR